MKILKQCNLTISLPQTFKPSTASEVPLTSYMRKVAKQSEQPKKPLILPSEEVNTATIADKSLSGTTMQHGVQSKASTDKKSKKKRNPPSSKPKTSKIVRESSQSTQVTDTQHAEEPVTTADATKGLDASESAEEQGNQPKTVDAEKVSLGDVPLDEFGRADANLDADESPFNTKSETKFIGKEVPKFIYNGSQVNEDANQGTGFSLFDQVMQEADSDLESMPGDKIESLSGFEADESDDDDLDMANSKNENVNASADKPSQSDPLGHLYKDISALTSRVGHLESSLAQQVVDKYIIRKSVGTAYVPADALDLKEQNKNVERSSSNIKDSVKQALPKFDKRVKKTLNDEIHELLIKPLNNDFNLLNKKERNRFFSLQKSLAKTIKIKVGKSVLRSVRKEVTAILSGADNRLPMLEKDMYDSWKSIMELYMMNRQHGRMILEYVENGPLIWTTTKKNGVTRPKKYSELSATEAIQADCDVTAEKEKSKNRLKVLTHEELEAQAAELAAYEENIVVDRMQRNLTLLEGVVGKAGMVIKEPEAGIFLYNVNFDLVYDELIYEIESRPDFVQTREIVEKNLDVSNEDSLGAKHQRAVKDSLSTKPQRVPQTYSSQIHHQGSQRLLEEILVSWYGYQLLCRRNTLKGLWRVRGGNTLMILLPFGEEQAELSFSE
ncbi:hypothetical protein Tco_0506647 [Tanacetum coccineum]